MPWLGFCITRLNVISPMGLIRKLFWFSLFLVATFGFTVLFEHGTRDYLENARKEYDYLTQMAGLKPAKKEDDSHRLY